QTRQPFGTANRASLQKTLNRSLRKFRLRNHCGACQLGVRFTESGFTGIAAPPLNAAFTEVAELLAGLVLAFAAGHGVSPLAFCEETSQNIFGSEAWVTPRFGLAPPTVTAADGAHHQLANWWRHLPHLLSCRPSC